MKVKKPYSQFTAFKAITKASFKAITRNPASLTFTIAFPLLVVLAFTFMPGKENQKLKIAFTQNTDTGAHYVSALKEIEQIQFVNYQDSLDLLTKIEKKEINVLIDIQNNQQNNQPEITLSELQGNSIYTERMKAHLFKILLSQDTFLQNRINNQLLIQEQILNHKEFRTIDYILPGQLGFALMAASIFGTGFVFLTLRNNLVLKRFFATPVRRETVLIAEGTARMVFQLLGAIVLILFGKIFLGLTLIHGFITFLNLLIISAIGVLVFMSLGFIAGSISDNETIVPLVSSLFALPQFILADTIIPIANFPEWLQPIANAMPLTYLNDALRAIAFQGHSLWEVRIEIGILLIWGIVGYLLAGKLFRWE